MVPVESWIRLEVRGQKPAPTKEWVGSDSTLSHSNKFFTKQPCRVSSHPILFLTLNLKCAINTTSNHTIFPYFIHFLLETIFMFSSPQNSNLFSPILTQPKVCYLLHWEKSKQTKKNFSNSILIFWIRKWWRASQSALQQTCQVILINSQVWEPLPFTIRAAPSRLYLCLAILATPSICP